jgi:hypothetical protein
MLNPSIRPSRILPALALAGVAMATSLVVVAFCAVAMAVAQDSNEAPAAKTSAELAPAPNPFAGLKPAFT